MFGSQIFSRIFGENSFNLTSLEYPMFFCKLQTNIGMFVWKLQTNMGRRKRKCCPKLILYSLRSRRRLSVFFFLFRIYFSSPNTSALYACYFFLFFSLSKKACSFTLFNVCQQTWIQENCFKFYPEFKAINSSPSCDWPRGLMDKASDFGSEDWGFESLRGRFLFPHKAK